MSGLVGIVNTDSRPVDRTELEQMVMAVAHRGPDSRGTWQVGSVGLGHLMLWTTPESLHEKLPLADEAGDLVLTADARLDNRTELIVALGLTERLPAAISDSQLILAAYERWGEGCPEHLLGDFAFALWDGRQQRLVCARDHFGVRSLYYDHSPGHAFVCATEIKALLALPDVPRQLNEGQVLAHLVGLEADQASTFYQDILRLPPAHTLTVSREGVTLRRYWALDPAREVRLPSDEAYAEAFRELFTEAVRCRLRSAFPTGAMLSGGLDSSSIACVAQRLLAQHGNGALHTFSLIFDDVPASDERPFINAVLDQGDFTPHFVPGDHISPCTEMERMMWHVDGAVGAPNLFLRWGICRSARQHGVRVLLDGLDGDTTVSHGLAYLTELARSGSWIRFTREAIQAAKRLRHPPWWYIWHRGVGPLAPAPVRQTWRALRGRRPPQESLNPNPTIHPAFASRCALGTRLQGLRAGERRLLRTARGEHYLKLTSGIIPFALEQANKASAAFAVEARHPFFDKRLAEFCLALPADQKLQHGWSRIVLRRAMRGILPPQIQWREGKSDLSHNFTHTLLTADRTLLDRVILHDGAPIASYVDLGALRETYARCVTRPRQSDPINIWRAASLAVWLQGVALSA